MCYWEMASSSWVGFKSTTVVPRREAPPIPSVDDDGWEFLLAPPPRRQQDGVRLLGADEEEESHIFFSSSIFPPVTLPCRGGGWRQSEDVCSPASSSVGLGADVGMACSGFLFVVVTVQFVLHQQDEDEDEDRGHDDTPDDDDHGTSQELETKTKTCRQLAWCADPIYKQHFLVVHCVGPLTFLIYQHLNIKRRMQTQNLTKTKTSYL